MSFSSRAPVAAFRRMRALRSAVQPRGGGLRVAGDELEAGDAHKRVRVLGGWSSEHALLEHANAGTKVVGGGAGVDQTSTGGKESLPAHKLSGGSWDLQEVHQLEVRTVPDTSQGAARRTVGGLAARGNKSWTGRPGQSCLSRRPRPGRPSSQRSRVRPGR